MSGRDAWSETEAAEAVTLARAGAGASAPLVAARDGWAAPAARDPARFRAAVAHQVRQDLWRALRTVRGFAPEVTVAGAPGGLEVTAGGRLLSGDAARGRVAATAARLLADGALRRRWTAYALRRAGGPAA